MQYRFVKEFARYTQAQIIGGFDGLTESEKDSRINKINNVLNNFDRGLITPSEAINIVLLIGGGDV